jgi:hypothetical protein
MKKKRNLDKYLLLSWKRILIIIAAWFISVILHNIIYMLITYFNPAFEGDEAFFFIIAVIVIPVYFVISVVYTIIAEIIK